jgi:Mycothiol maleylpyruvate isomerase N-terminal domain
MDRSYPVRNAAGLARLRTFVEHVSDAELDRDLGGGWTVATALAHLAFWDRFVTARWAFALREGLQLLPALPDSTENLINEAALADWQACPPRRAAHQALDAAEAATQLIAGLNDEAVSAVQASGHVRHLDRSLHLHDHLDQIERALSQGAVR